LSQYIRSSQNGVLIYLKIFVVLILLASGRLHAYIDPGMGSYFFQTLIAFFLAIVFWWRKILRFVVGLFGRSGKFESKDHTGFDE